MKSTKRIAVCGVLSALSVSILLMTFFPYATYAAAALAGMVFVACILEFGVRYGVLCYVVTAVLALLLTPDQEAKWLFVLFFGYYPMLHHLIQPVRKAVLAWIIKLILFNTVMVLCYGLFNYVLDIPIEDVQIGGFQLMWVLFPLANFMFVLYDMALTRFGVLYRVRLHPHIKRLFRL